MLATQVTNQLSKLETLEGPVTGLDPNDVLGDVVWKLVLSSGKLPLLYQAQKLEPKPKPRSEVILALPLGDSLSPSCLR